MSTQARGLSWQSMSPAREGQEGDTDGPQADASSLAQRPLLGFRPPEPAASQHVSLCVRKVMSPADLTSGPRPGPSRSPGSVPRPPGQAARASCPQVSPQPLPHRRRLHAGLRTAIGEGGADLPPQPSHSQVLGGPVPAPLSDPTCPPCSLRPVCPLTWQSPSLAVCLVGQLVFGTRP